MNEKKKGKLFEWRLLPMDMGRLVLAGLPLLYRFRRYDVDGQRFRRKIEGGHIIVANHSSFKDPLLVGSCFWYRRMFFLAAEAVMRNRLVAWLLRGAGCIKIDRNISDIEAIRKSVSVLKAKRCLAMFPQGGISQEEEFSQIKSGAVLIALQAGVPILPMYCTRKNIPWYRPTTVVIGEPLDCLSYCKKKMPALHEIEETSAELLKRLEDCRNTYMHLEEKHVKSGKID